MTCASAAAHVRTVIHSLPFDLRDAPATGQSLRMTPELEALMAAQAGVFSAAQAAHVGVTADDLRVGKRSGRLRVVRRSIYTSTARLDAADGAMRHLIDAAGALLARDALSSDAAGRFAVGHLSAALVWGLPAPRPELVVTGPADLGHEAMTITGNQPARIVDLVGADRHQRTYAWGVQIHPAGLPPSDVTWHKLLPCTTLARTAVDLARSRDADEAIVVLDRVMRLGVSRPELLAVLERHRGWPGVRQAERLIAFADPRAESPAESVARLILAELGFPPPDLQVDLFDARGLWIARVDMVFQGQRTVIEIDGKVKYTDRNVDPAKVLWDEKLREDRLREAGWQVIRLTWAHLKGSREELRARVLRAFAMSARATG